MRRIRPLSWISTQWSSPPTPMGVLIWCTLIALACALLAVQVYAMGAD